MNHPVIPPHQGLLILKNLAHRGAVGEDPSRFACEYEIERAIKDEGQALLGWRDVPVDLLPPASLSLENTFENSLSFVILSILQSHRIGSFIWSDIGFVKLPIGIPTLLKNLFFDKSSLTFFCRGSASVVTIIPFTFVFLLAT